MNFAQLVSRINEIDSEKTNTTNKTNTINEGTVQEVQESGKLQTEVGATKDLLTKFNEIQDTNPYVPVVIEAKKEEVEVEETMQNRFAKFMKAERTQGTEVEEMKQMVDEGTAEYEYADRAFIKMAETVNTLEKMCREGGMLEERIQQAGGDAASLIDMRNALSSAYEACEQAHYDALGGAASENQPKN